jgi:hypothetical protein
MELLCVMTYITQPSKARGSAASSERFEEEGSRMYLRVALSRFKVLSNAHIPLKGPDFLPGPDSTSNHQSGNFSFSRH